MKKNLSIFFFLIFLSANLFAQKRSDAKGDYLVTNSGDTLYGKFKKKLFGESLFIVNGEEIELDPTQYAAYFAKHTLFRSIKVSGDTNAQWMEVLENGKISLYQYLMSQLQRNGQMPVNRVIWLAQKTGGPLLNVNGILSTEDVAKSNLSSLFSDDTKIQNAFAESSFTLKNIRYFIQQYNLDNSGNQ